ncbi:MAG: alpha-mannosidase [Clostridia bacterium]|nr:alpha-mannosidase [Clostridia bacterium]
MENEKKTLHFVSHTHWDREWYMPFEAHRVKLVEFFDRLLKTLDTDPSFKSFHLDGQAIVLEDYLEIRPEMREKIEKYIAEDRIVIGPWYILQDEYLVDGESNVRNMLVGRQVSAEYGKVSDVGYFPDAFGNIGQAPQILRGFGIDTVAFGRGTSPRKGDRLDTGEENYGKWVSEVRWRSPDGSEVLGTTFLRWYNNANEIPSDPEAAARRIAAIRDSMAQCSVAPDLLFMNGCDHQPVQCDIGQIIEKLAPTFPDRLVHSNFKDYFDAIRPYRDRFGIFVGELDGEYGDGWGTLANTASARIYLKQLNSACEHLLEQRIEPLSVFSFLDAGDEIRRDYFRWLWKTLLKNHPHDSICGCSVDPVHREMVSRFERVLAAGHEIEARETEAFTAVLDTASVGTDYAVTVFNPHAFAASEPVKVNLDLPEDSDVRAENIRIKDGDRILPVDVREIGVVFDYILPPDRFRVPFRVRRFELTFTAENVPALGYKTFAVLTDAGKAQTETDLTVYRRGMMNKRLKIAFAADGSLTVTDRRTRASYVTGIFEDSGDVGDEYVYVEAKDGVRVSTEGKRAKLELLASTPSAAVFRVTHEMTVPAGLKPEDRAQDGHERQGDGRRVGTAKLTVTAEYTLRAGADRLDVKTVIDNTAENHRLVMLTRNDVKTDMLLAEGQFDVVERPITPWKGWKNPSKPGKMTTFFGLSDAEKGLLVATRGLCEYEVLRDGQNTMALTVHRGVDRLGDWGVFPTPEAQCKGLLTVEYSLIPFGGTRAERERAENAAYAFAAGQPAAFCAKTHGGKKPAAGSLLGLSGTGFVLSAAKMAEGRDSVILRVFNPHAYDTKMKLDLAEGGRFSEVWTVNLAEERQTKAVVRNGKTSVEIPAKKIVTVELVPVK